MANLRGWKPSFVSNLMPFFIFILPIILFCPIYYFFFSPKTQLFGSVSYRGKASGEKIIALTFDDGPNEPYTSQILDILQSHGIKATFFIVGENAERYPITVKKIFAGGHVIGNHSYSHSFFAPLKFPNFREEIIKTQNKIDELIGKQPIIFRPPWFFRQPAMLKTAKKCSLTTVTGTFGSNWEVFGISPEKIAEDALKKIRPGAILIFHDGYNNKGSNRLKTVGAIKIIIPRLLSAGYKFVTVPELLSLADYQ